MMLKPLRRASCASQTARVLTALRLRSVHTVITAGQYHQGSGYLII